MTPYDKKILDCFPPNKWISFDEIRKALPSVGFYSLRTYALPRLRKMRLVERSVGFPARYRRVSGAVTVEDAKRAPYTQRKCLCCANLFRSEGSHNRVCFDCREAHTRHGDSHAEFSFHTTGRTTHSGHK